MNKSHVCIIAGLIACPLIFFCGLSPGHTLPIQIIKIGYGLGLVEQSNFSAAWNELILKYLTFPLDDHYGSHTVVLLAAAYACDSGAILELGMGSSSTPLLHQLAIDQNRFLLSADSDLRWVNHFSSKYGNHSLHQMRHVDVQTEMGVEWANVEIMDAAPWSIVFIDHRPGPRRQFDLLTYSQRSTLVILHDTEKSSMYRYNEALPAYRYQYRFTRLQTYTDVLSTKNETLVNRIRFLLESIPSSFFPNASSKAKS